MNWRHVQDLYMVLFVNWKCCICYATQETFNFQSTENVFQNVFRRLKDMKYISFAHFRNPNSSPVSGCHRSPPWLLINLIVSEQGGTVPPWLWCPDRTDLSSSDHQAEKKKPTANCLDSSHSVAASGNACQMLAVWYCLCVVWEPLPSQVLCNIPPGNLQPSH